MYKAKNDNQVSVDELKASLDYDSETGCFKWKINKGNVKAGNIAGTKHYHGYLTININKKQYFSHRLAWVYFYGSWPDGFIDHINGIKTDNRIVNLRTVSYTGNNQNLRRSKKTNKSGLLGVSWHKKTKKWQASIRINGVCTSLGYFDDPNEAHEMYVHAKRKHHSTCSI